MQNKGIVLYASATVLLFILLSSYVSAECVLGGDYVVVNATPYNVTLGGCTEPDIVSGYSISFDPYCIHNDDDGARVNIICSATPYSAVYEDINITFRLYNGTTLFFEENVTGRNNTMSSVVFEIESANVGEYWNCSMMAWYTNSTGTYESAWYSTGDSIRPCDVDDDGSDVDDDGSCPYGCQITIENLVCDIYDSEPVVTGILSVNKTKFCSGTVTVLGSLANRQVNVSFCGESPGDECSPVYSLTTNDSGETDIYFSETGYYLIEVNSSGLDTLCNYTNYFINISEYEHTCPTEYDCSKITMLFSISGEESEPEPEPCYVVTFPIFYVKVLYDGTPLEGVNVTFKVENATGYIISSDSSLTNSSGITSFSGTLLEGWNYCFDRYYEFPDGTSCPAFDDPCFTCSLPDCGMPGDECNPASDDEGGCCDGLECTADADDGTGRCCIPEGSAWNCDVYGECCPGLTCCRGGCGEWSYEGEPCEEDSDCCGDLFCNTDTGLCEAREEEEEMEEDEGEEEREEEYADSSKGKGLNLTGVLGTLVGPNYTCILGDCSPETDAADASFFNTGLMFRDGCAGFFIKIHNWIICDILWLVLIVLSLWAGYRFKDIGRAISMAVIFVPLLIGFFTYVWVGIVVAVLEHLFKSVKVEELEERRPKAVGKKKQKNERHEKPAPALPPGFKKTPSASAQPASQRTETEDDEIKL